MEETRHKPLVSIIISACNNLNYTKLSIESLYKYSSHLNFELISVNNGSTDGTEDFFNYLPNQKKINISQNCGMPKAFNEGLKLVEGDFTVLLTNDLVLTHNWLDNLLTCAQSDDRIGMVVPVCNFASYFQQVNLEYSNIQELSQVAEKYNQSDPRKWEERLRLINYTALMRTSPLKNLGGFDEIYSPYLFEDDDLSFRIRRAGYKLILARDTYVHHFGAVTQKAHYATKNLGERNRRIFSSRFGVDAWDDTDIDMDILGVVDYNKTKDVNILGIGSHCGGTLLQIKNKFRENGVRDVRLWGFTEDERYLTDLRTICEEAICERLENITEIYKDKKFDCIVIDDVEEIHNPKRFLKKIKEILKYDGQLIFPVANELYYLNFIKLLNGNPDSGGDRILTRYFNLDKLAKSLEKNGFEELKIIITKSKIPMEHEIFVESLKNLKNLSQFENSNPASEVWCTKRFIFTVKGIKPIKNILLYSGYDYLLNGMVFDDRNFSNSLGVESGENFIWVMREELAEHGYKMSTLDNLSDVDDAELILFYDVPKYYGNHCFLGIYHFVYKGNIYFEEFLKRKAQGKTKARLVAILNEPPCVMPENFDMSILASFDLVFTYYDDLVDNRKYFKFYTPQPEEVINPYARGYWDKKLCTFFGANKSSLIEGELYSERRKAILFFQENHSEEFDFFGKSWDGSGFTCYKGAIDNKLEILSQYKFSICYENSSLNGWISEKIFDSFFAGCVPIYLGAPNITDYIPTNTFIDRRHFLDYERLYDFLSSMGESEYNEYLNNIKDFLKSDGFKKFTRKSFAQDLVRVITGQ